ncbi:hypothetical protein SUGI_0494710 [Cryptomeria japonica]|nr:hypothetical protein SUGI_0494710 [Cryptomeria japonica]
MSFGGAAKGNPGEAGYGAVLRGDDGKIIFAVRGYIGLATNNEEELVALSRGINLCRINNINKVEIEGTLNWDEPLKSQCRRLFHCQEDRVYDAIVEVVEGNLASGRHWIGDFIREADGDVVANAILDLYTENFVSVLERHWLSRGKFAPPG